MVVGLMGPPKRGHSPWSPGTCGRSIGTASPKPRTGTARSSGRSGWRPRPRLTAGVRRFSAREQADDQTMALARAV